MHQTTNQTREIELPCPCCGQAVTMLNGLYLRQLRESANVTQHDFALKFNVSGPYISDIERNRRRCPPLILAAYLELHQP